MSAKQALIDVANFGQEPDEQREFLAGSPRIALDLEHPFSRYIFIEKNAERVAKLQELKAEYGTKRKIEIQQQDCNQYLLKQIVSNRRIDWGCNRAVVFLDPFGMQAEWATLQALAATQAIEVFVNFPVGMAIQRLLLRKPENFTKAQSNKLDTYFGSSEWYETLYKKRKTLFDDNTEKIEKSGKALLKWYRDRLRQIFGYVSKAALFRNTQGGHLYYLLLATPNKNGARIASHVLDAGETV